MSDRAQQLLWTWALRAAALAGLYHEVVITKGERPFLLTAFLAMMGLPYVIGVGKKGGGQ